MTVPIPPSAAPSSPSVLYQLVTSRLDSDPLEYIRQRREIDPPTPFRLIAQEISAKSGVDVTYEAVRRWWRATEEGKDELRTEEAPNE